MSRENIEGNIAHLADKMAKAEMIENAIPFSDFDEYTIIYDRIFADLSDKYLYIDMPGLPIELPIASLKKLYKGTIEVDLSSKMQSRDETKKFSLRGFERALIGTGMELKFPPCSIGLIKSLPSKQLKKGVLVDTVLKKGYKGEINFYLINLTPFKIDFEYGEKVAQLFFQQL